MIKVYCHTNLDLVCEEWPYKLPALPRVGDWIESKIDHNGFQLTLEVVSVTWAYSYNTDSWEPSIELHDRKVFNRSIKEFYEWYAPKVGKSVHAFI